MAPATGTYCEGVTSGRKNGVVKRMGGEGELMNDSTACGKEKIEFEIERTAI